MSSFVCHYEKEILGRQYKKGLEEVRKYGILMAQQISRRHLWTHGNKDVEDENQNS